MLVCCVNADTDVDTDITISVSGGGLTWTNRAERDEGDAGANGGHASIWTAPVPAKGDVAVSVRRTAGNGGSNRISAKVYTVLGADNANPVGATGEGSTATTTNTPNAYVSTVNGSRGFACATDWGQNGTLTSTDEEDVADYAGAIAAISLHKAADTVSLGTTVTVNFDTDGGGGSLWNWVAVEILPAPGPPGGYWLQEDGSRIQQEDPNQGFWVQEGTELFPVGWVKPTPNSLIRM